MAQGDLVSLAALKAHLGVLSNADDAALACLISQISRAIASFCNRPFFWPRDVVDLVDGNGWDRLQLRHWPAHCINSLTIDGVAVAAANGPFDAGYVLEGADADPPGAMQMVMLRQQNFSRGWRNVAISYRAGYQVSDEAAIIPAAPFFIESAQDFGAFACDLGVSYDHGAPMQPVANNPGVGQYVCDSFGGYYFSPQDSGAGVLLNYGYVPADLAQAALEWAADRYRYRERIALASKSLGGQETASFRISDMPAFVALALARYVRVIAN